MGLERKRERGIPGEGGKRLHFDAESGRYMRILVVGKGEYRGSRCCTICRTRVSDIDRKQMRDL